MLDEQDFKLPSLAPYLRLARAPDDKGEPTFTLFNPVANAYFKIDWIAFECISRMPLHDTAFSLKNAIERETTLTITLKEIEDITAFLQKNGLLSLMDQKIFFRSQNKMPLWKKVFHQYLYFSIPLFKPQKFLERTYPAISWMHNPLFLKSWIALLACMVLVTLPRMDEFLNTFSNLISAEGAISALLVFAFIKIIHEFAHAYTAIRYGVKVPHMGVALILMYPVLYTETTGSWALPSRKARFHIGMAGICAELFLAALFLLIWHVSPDGSLAQSLSFLVVTISLISSLLVNLNPFMRFDGYYMLADASGFDNLQTRACDFARHALRRALFALDDPPPENLPREGRNFLTLFGFGLLIFRFILFTGIAILVYNVFFQPLGFILMMAELTWFIFLPVWAEIKIWIDNRTRIFSSRRSLIPAGVLLLLLLCIFLPWRTSILLPAVAYAGLHETIYPPAPARIIALYVSEGQLVEEGDILVELDSPELDYNINAARQELERLETLKRRGQSMAQAMRSNTLSDEAIEKAKLKLQAFEEQKARLTIKASFSGTVRDIGMDINEGRFVAQDNALFSLVDPRTTRVNAFTTENEREKILSGSTAIFFSEYRTVTIHSLSLSRIADAGNKEISWPELAATYGGPIASDLDDEGKLVARRTLYEVVARSPHAAPDQILRGYLRVEAPPASIFSIIFNKLAVMVRREGKV